MIFCGNSYHWFDRARVVPEFKRILRESKHVNVVLANLWHGAGSSFREDKFATKEFEYTIYQDWTMYLAGMLSASSSPNPGDDNFEEFCRSQQQHFERYSKDGKLETQFKITCEIGNVNDLN